MKPDDLDHSLEVLLDLDGGVFIQSTGEWTKIEARRVDASEGRPHGVKYSLTLHRGSGERILGYDNAHAVDAHRRIEWDHKHFEEKTRPYKYRDAGTLLADFFGDVIAIRVGSRTSTPRQRLDSHSISVWQSVRPAIIGGWVMSTKTIRIGILSWEKYQERTLAIARGEIKPKPGDPKIFLPSLKAAGEILSEKNIELLRVIATRKPASISELAPMVHRAQPNLTRTLRKMEQYGLIDMVPEGNSVRPVAKGKKVHVEADFNFAAA